MKEEHKPCITNFQGAVKTRRDLLSVFEPSVTRVRKSYRCARHFDGVALVNFQERLWLLDNLERL